MGFWCWLTFLVLRICNLFAFKFILMAFTKWFTKTCLAKENRLQIYYNSLYVLFGAKVGFYSSIGYSFS